jgi:hypothetical protein
MNAHTPGPWRIAPGNFIVAECLSDDPSTGRIVAEVPCQSGNPADLSLIAAAPEQHEALEGVAIMLRTALKEYADEPWAVRVFAAIRKATGAAR